METIATQAGLVRYEQRGDGPPLVLLHANPGDHRDFAAVVPVLCESFRTIAVDWPGYGESPPPDPPSSSSAMLCAGMLADLAEALDLRAAGFVGNSLGGYAACRLAIDQPQRVGALVLVDAGGFTTSTPQTIEFCKTKGTEQVTQAIAADFARGYLKRRNPVVEQIIARAEEERTLPSRVAVDAAIWRSFIDPEHDLRVRATTIDCPTLLIWGAHDPVLPAETDGKTAEQCIPNARLVVLDTGHISFAEDPVAFLAEVVPFLKGALAGASRAVPSDV